MSGKSRRGFASMNRDRQREIASKGGRAAHEKGTAHEWSADEARVAGQRGGVVVSKDREHMSAIGRAGGEARGRNKSRARVLGQASAMEREAPIAVSSEPSPASSSGRRANGEAAERPRL